MLRYEMEFSKWNNNNNTNQLRVEYTSACWARTVFSRYLSLSFSSFHISLSPWSQVICIVVGLFNVIHFVCKISNFVALHHKIYSWNINWKLLLNFFQHLPIFFFILVRRTFDAKTKILRKNESLDCLQLCGIWCMYIYMCIHTSNFLFFSLLSLSHMWSSICFLLFLLSIHLHYTFIRPHTFTLDTHQQSIENSKHIIVARIH